VNNCIVILCFDSVEFGKFQIHVIWWDGPSRYPITNEHRRSYYFY